MVLNVDKIREDFPILSTKTASGKKLVYLDSAATSQKPLQVIKTVCDYYKTYNANIHRGLYDLSLKSTEAYENSKKAVASFINAESHRDILYGRNTTEAINVVALSWGEANIGKNDHILITKMEHHSNIVPWQLLAKRKGAVLDYVELKDGMLDMESFKKQLEKKPKIVAFTHVSNVLGTINGTKELTKLAHKHGAIVLVDGAQSAPHMPVDVRAMDCDFFAFSSHKMLGPAGVGVLYGKDELLEAMEPVYGGGDMIRSVTFKESTWNELPWKFESGTPNIEGAIGLGAAVEYLNKIGIDSIRSHEIKLTKYALKRLEETKGVTVYGIGSKAMTNANRGGAVSFNIKGAHPHDVSSIFNSEGIAIRAGHHCAMPLVNEVLGVPAVARMSFYLYNKEEEVDKAVEAVETVRKILRIKN